MLTCCVCVHPPSTIAGPCGVWRKPTRLSTLGVSVDPQADRHDNGTALGLLCHDPRVPRLPFPVPVGNLRACADDFHVRSAVLDQHR